MTSKSKAAAGNGELPLSAIDFVELYVGNAFQAAHFYRTAFGFNTVAYAGPETGIRDQASFVAQHRDIRLVLTTPLDPKSDVAEHISRHGDGVKDIAFTVDDVEGTFNEAIKRGGRAVMEPTAVEDKDGRVVKATIKTFGDTVHSLIQRKDYDGTFLPHYRAVQLPAPSGSTDLNSIDHIAFGLEAALVDQYTEYYCNVLGFRKTRVEDTSSEYSAMNSSVVQNESGKVIFVLVEPVASKRRSPIDEYLTYYGGSGVHHIALSAGDIIRSVSALRDNGVEFTVTPRAYYEGLESRVGEIPQGVGPLCDLNILVDRDSWGLLLQIFSKPVQGRPTFFYEVIQRMGARGFGSGNVKALFEAIEREQALRGNS